MNALIRASMLIAIVAPPALGPSPATAQANPSNYTTGTRYDVVGRVVGTIAPDPDGDGPIRFAAVRNTYDKAGRLTKIEKGELANWKTEAVEPAAWGADFTIFQTMDTLYDTADRKVVEIVTGATDQTATQYSYDNLGRLECTAVRMNPGAYSSLPSSTSACSSTAASVDGPDRITKNVYDAAGQLIQVREAVGVTNLEAAEATYSYTANGKREFLIDANGNRAQMVYDEFDQLQCWIFPSKTRPSNFNDSTQTAALSSAGAAGGNCSQLTGDLEKYTYDAVGNRTSLRKRDGTTIYYAYDPLNRLASKTSSPVAVVGGGGGTGTNCNGVTFKITTNLQSGVRIEGGTLVFTVTKTGTTSNSCDVYYATANDDAMAGSDYVAVPSTKLTFAAAETTKTVNVSTIDDTVIETDETFKVSLANPSDGATLGTPASVFGTITDNDGADPPPPDDCSIPGGPPMPCT